MSLLLLDTRILVWAASAPERLSDLARSLITDARNTPAFSAASLWEVVMKTGLGRPDFRVDARRLRRGSLQAGYREFAVTSEHAVAVARLQPLHKDPFDRLLIAQADVEGATLLTADATVARYAGPVRFAG